MNFYRKILLLLVIVAASLELFEYKKANTDIPLAIEYGKDLVVYHYKTIPGKTQNLDEQQKCKISSEAQCCLIAYIKHSKRRNDSASFSMLRVVSLISIRPFNCGMPVFMPVEKNAGLNSYLIRFMRC